MAVERDAWLAKDLPPLIDPAKEPAYAITSLKIERNHVDQEILSGTVERKWLVTTLPESVTGTPPAVRRAWMAVSEASPPG